MTGVRVCKLPFYTFLITTRDFRPVNGTATPARRYSRINTLDPTCKGNSRFRDSRSRASSPKIKREALGVNIRQISDDGRKVGR